MRRAGWLLATIVLAGCGPATSVSDPVQAPGTGVSDDAGPLVSCGAAAPGWPVDVMATGIEGSLTPAEVAEAFTQMLADERYQVELKHFLPEGPSTEARVLVQQGDTYVLGVGRWTDDGPQEGALELVMRRTGRTWEWRGGGSCNLLGPVLAPADSRVVLSAPAGGLDSSSTTVTLLVHELQCAGAREPDPYLHEPDVTESDDSVVVTWTSDAITSEATCPGNPSVERTITLSAPLGDRPLLDGSYYPPRPVVPAGPMEAGQ